MACTSLRYLSLGWQSAVLTFRTQLSGARNKLSSSGGELTWHTWPWVHSPELCRLLLTGNMTETRFLGQFRHRLLIEEWTDKYARSICSFSVTF